MTPKPQQLNYGVQRRPRRWWRVALLAVALLAGAVLLERWSRPLGVQYARGQNMARVFQAATAKIPTTTELVYGQYEDRVLVHREHGLR